MKAITFIGTGNYQETQYEFAGKHFKTALFPAILPQFFPQLQQIIVFVTSKAKQHDNFTLAAKELGGLMRAVDIPDGHSEEELWKIFDAMIENVQPGDELVFDITHSFRSLPFITFLVAAFLRIAREVTVNHVLYGAFEARNEQTGISPVFDLSPFIQLLDWTVATQQFLETGNAQNIAKFLEREGKDQKIGVLKDVGHSLEALSLQLLLCQPIEVMETAEELANRLERMKLKDNVSLKPFTLLLDTIQDDYASRAEPRPEENVERALIIQYELIQWYVQKRLFMQAITLIREWVVSAVGWKLDGCFALDLNRRDEIEKGLSGLAKRQQQPEIELNRAGTFLWNNYPKPDQLGKTYDAVIQMRNSVNHAGMSKSPQKAQKIEKRIKNEILAELEDFFQWLNIKE